MVLSVDTLDSDAGEALQLLGYAPLQTEVAKRGRFLAHLHANVLQPCFNKQDNPFGQVTFDLSGLGVLLQHGSSCSLCLPCGQHSGAARHDYEASWR